MKMKPKRPAIWVGALLALAGGLASGMAMAATEAKEAKPNIIRTYALTSIVWYGR